MRGSTLGIVGNGAIGKAVGRIAEAFGQRVLAYDIFPQPGLTDFETLREMGRDWARIAADEEDALLSTPVAVGSSTRKPWPMH
jgi:lactate dehydrogenase-like 2-hydroxyacid dehydrogenase